MRAFQKIKNIFSFFLKKEFVFLFLALIFFLFPLKTTAQFPFIGNPFMFLGSILILAMLAFLVMVTQIFAKLAGLILDVVIGPYLVNVGYTNPATNQIIKFGLSITQGLVNILLVVALIYTALSIALRLAGETQAKKMLIRLIFVALIVNFAPVICGLIVDAANIVMNYFLIGMKEGISGILTPAILSGGSFIEDLLKLNSFKGQIILITKSVMQLILNLVIGSAFILFAVLFLFRYLAIWILVILAPLAFAAWVFPPGRIRRIWDMWWNNFLQWSIVGIPLAFFLWLGTELFKIYNEIFKEKFALPGIEPEITDFFNQSFLYFVVVGFLFLGFIIGLQTSAMGASAIISETKKGLKGAGRWMGKTGIRGIRGLKPVSQAEEAIMKGLERTPIIGRMVGGPGAYERAKAREMDLARKQMESIPNTPEGNEDLRRLILSPVFSRLDRMKRAAALELLAKRKELSHKTKEDKMASFIPEAQSLGIDVSAIYKARPDFANNIIITEPQTGIKRPMTIKEAMTKIEPEEFHRFVQKEALRSRMVAYYVAVDNRKFEQFAQHGSIDKKRELKNTLITTSWPTALRSQIATSLNSLSTDPRWQV